MFTNREKEILSLIIQGLSNKEIAEQLSISFHTTKAHISNIFSKLGVSNRVQAAIKFLQMNEK